MRELVTEHGDAGGETGGAADRESRSDGHAVREVVQRVAENDHHGNGVASYVNDGRNKITSIQFFSECFLVIKTVFSLYKVPQ